MNASGEMFDGAAAAIDERHRDFFVEAGDARQVWALNVENGELFFLAEGSVDQDVRDCCSAGQLRCPMADCPDPRFVAHGGHERRHHFAHKVAHTPHKSGAIYRAEAVAMLADWVRRKYEGQVDVETREADDVSIVSVRSLRTGVTVELAVTYDRGYDWFGGRRREGRQLLLGHTKSMLLPRAQHATTPNAWWCGEASLASSLAGWRSAAIAVNPQARLVATMSEASAVVEAGLAARDVWKTHPHLAVIDPLDDCWLDDKGLVTPALAKLRALWLRIDERHRQLEKESAARGRPEQEHAAQAEHERASAAERLRNNPAMAAKIKEGRAKRFARARVHLHEGKRVADARDREFDRRAAGKSVEERLRLIHEIYLGETPNES